MAQDLELAMEDLENCCKSVYGLKVIPENQEPGSNAFTLSLISGPKETQPAFGTTKDIYYVGLSFTARKPDYKANHVKLKELEDAIIEDRRRNGNAQTTIVGPEWLVNDESGREGITYENFVGVVIYES